MKKIDIMLSVDSHGYLEIIIGPMFSGKTSKLLDIYKQCDFCNISVCVVNHADDTRYHESMLSSHDKIMIPCIQTSSIKKIWEGTNLEDIVDYSFVNHLKIRQSDVILINEAQFFDDLYPCVIDMLKEKKHVYIAGLDGDFERKKFGQILDLIPYCDKVTKLNSLCGLCKNGEHGIFSHRLSNEKEQLLVGSNNYIPVCRKCYHENSSSSLNIYQNDLN